MGIAQRFVFSTIGAAVGIGNIWQHYDVAGKNGSAAFLIIFMACIVLVSLPLLIAELSLGRRAQGDAVSAFKNADCRGY